MLRPQRSKIEIAEQLKTSIGSTGFNLLGEFLSCLIYEARCSNDDAKDADVIRNQQRIAACKEIAQYLEITFDI